MFVRATALALALSSLVAIAHADDDDAPPAYNEIINGSQEWAPDGIDVTVKNWKLRTGDPSRWPDGRTHPVITQDQVPSNVSSTGGVKAIDSIVLHETGSPVGFARTDGMVHFLVDGDATIFQLGDLARRFNHASNGVLNRASIGIETAVGQGGYHIFSSGGAGRVQIRWIGAYNRYLALPSPQQCEAEYQLVSFLLDKYPHIPKRVLNASIAPGYFILNSNTIALNPHPASSGILEPVEVGGIVSHSIVQGHPDGGSLAAYVWLRLEKGMDASEAYALMQEIVTLPPIDVMKTPAVKSKLAPAAWSMVTVVDPTKVPSGRLGGGGGGDDDDTARTPMGETVIERDTNSGGNGGGAPAEEDSKDDSDE